MRQAVIVALAFGAAWGQTPTSNLSFEVASVKPSGPQSVRGSSGGPGTRDPERFTYSGAVLRDLLFNAYLQTGVDGYRDQISGPGWIDTEKYDVAVKIPPGTTKEQFRKMLQSMLAERFELVVHHETKVLPVYELVVAKNGPKLTESTLKASVEMRDAVVLSTGSPEMDHDENGFPVLPAGRPGLAMRLGPGTVNHLKARQQPTSKLAQMLSLYAGRRVIDKTGLTGEYDFTLYYGQQLTDASAADEDPAPILFDAVQQQLGLKLVEAKAPFDVVVVDHAEKAPSEN
jgi:uncharacterized protein (TIGR03435 family)